MSAPVSVSFLTSIESMPPSAIVFEDDAPMLRSAFLTWRSAIFVLPIASALMSSGVTSPLMMSAEPTVFWPGSEPSTASAVPPVRTRHSAIVPDHSPSRSKSLPITPFTPSGS